jgi:hypothetical protein
MRLEEYEALFKGAMPQINWRLAHRERWKVETAVITDRQALGELFLPWTASGVTGDPTSFSLRVSEVSANLEYVGKEWRTKILRFAQAYSLSKEPILLVLPAIKSMSAMTLLLDGSHRTTACHLAFVEFRVLVCSLLPKSDTVWRVQDLIGC